MSPRKSLSELSTHIEPTKMSYSLRICVLFSVALAMSHHVCLSDTRDGAFQVEPPPAVPDGDTKFSSLLEACRTASYRLCKSFGLQSMPCLLKNRVFIPDYVCSRWLDARDACMGLSTETPDLCALPDRRCFQRFIELHSSFTDDCRSSEFFKSVDGLSRAHAHLPNKAPHEGPINFYGLQE